MRELRFALAAVALVGLAACGSGRAERVGAASSAVQGGSDDHAHAFAVGVCAGEPGLCRVTCSGVLVAPNLVLTARHCVQEAPTQLDCATSKWGQILGGGGDYWITTSYSMHQTTDGWHSATRVQVPPQPLVCGSDVAVLILADVIAPREATPIAPNVLDAATDHARFGTSETTIGYGLSAAIPEPVPSPAPEDTSGYRRVRTNIPIVCTPNDPDVMQACDDATIAKVPLGPNEMLAGDGTCDGDSGGAALAQAPYDQGSFVALALLARGGVDPNDPTHCMGGVLTRLDGWRDWLALEAHDAALYGGYPEPDWALAVENGAPDAGAPAPSTEAGPTAVEGESSAPRAASGGCAAAPGRIEGEWGLVGLALAALATRRRRRARRRPR